jgi:hypothetical protein
MALQSTSGVEKLKVALLAVRLSSGLDSVLEILKGRVDDDGGEEDGDERSP